MLAVLHTMFDCIAALAWWLFGPILRLMNPRHSLPYATPSRIAPDPRIFPNYIQNKQGIWLYTYSWWPHNIAPKDVKGVVFICQGVGEHSGRYEGFVNELCEKEGYVVFAVDHQGQGKSEGDRKHVERFEDYVDDYFLFITAMYERTLERLEVDLSAKPRFILGHSMGGLITVHVVRRGRDFGVKPEHLPRDESLRTALFKTSSDVPNAPHYFEFSGVILSAPALQADPKLATPLMKTLARILGTYLPKLGLDSIPVSTVCNNRQVVELASQDPLFPAQAMRARWGAEMLIAMGKVQDNVAAYSEFQALLLVQGLDDKLVVPIGAREFFDASVCKDKELCLLEGMSHESLNEVHCEKVRTAITSWIQKRL